MNARTAMANFVRLNGYSMNKAKIVFILRRMTSLTQSGRIGIFLLLSLGSVCVNGQAWWGMVDPSLDPGVSANSVIRSLCVQDDGKIIIGGSFSSYQGVPRKGIARLHPDGTLDQTFNAPEFTWVHDVFAVAIDEDQRIIIGGRMSLSWGEVMLIRLLPDGSLDGEFPPVTGGVSGETIQDVVILPGEQGFLVGGYFSSILGIQQKSIARITTAGSLDPSFAVGTGFDNLNEFGQTQVRSLALTPNGDLLVMGEFSHYNGSSLESFGFAKLSGNGQIHLDYDLTFMDSQGFPASVLAALPLSDGSVFLAGSFTFVDGAPSRNLVRIDQQGTIVQAFDQANEPSVLTDVFGICRLRAYGDDGFLLIGSYPGQTGLTWSKLVHLSLDGTTYPGQQGGIGMNFDAIESNVFVAPDNDILICGSFTTYNEFARRRIVRIRGRDGPAAGTCLAASTLSVQPNTVFPISGDTGGETIDIWMKLDLVACQNFTISTCDASGVVEMASGLFSSCPSSVETWMPFESTIPNACGGSDRTISSLEGGSYWLTFQVGPGPYSMEVATSQCLLEDCLGVFGGSALPWTLCNDGDSQTVNDIWTEECICLGEIPTDCLGVPNGQTVPGTPCDDGILATTNDQYDSECDCVGLDCAGMLGGAALPGAPCDDGVNWTYNDFWGPDCNCMGIGAIGIAEAPVSAAILSLQPNPCSSEDVILTLHLPNRMNGVISLVDAIGKVVWKYPIEQAVGAVRIPIPTATSAPGPYLVQWSSEGAVMSRRLMIQ